MALGGLQLQQALPTEPTVINCLTSQHSFIYPSYNSLESEVGRSRGFMVGLDYGCNSRKGACSSP